jgi:hypothetical protein
MGCRRCSFIRCAEGNSLSGDFRQRIEQRIDGWVAADIRLFDVPKAIRCPAIPVNKQGSE